MTSEMRRQPLRVISMAWGEPYVDQFLEYCLPALLAPGNLPVLSEHFAATLVFVTEERLFPRVRTHPNFQHAAAICNVLLVPLDDLVATPDSYGMSITYALYRGFEDLGQTMTDTYLLFVNSDFILAENSYRGLLPYLERGERLVLAPSYCANAEDVIPEIIAARNAMGCMALPHRRLADIILCNRHLSIRAKTMNQRIYSATAIDQIYFAVNESTLLGHQLPVAVVAMKPERQPEEINSYWDYGLIAEFCPSQTFAVIGDSDEFLMMELRERDRARGDVALGWPSAKEIAQGLRNVVTGYTAHAGSQPLTLHASGIPVGIDLGRRMLRDFLDEILQHLRPLPHHVGHLQWHIHAPRFQEARRRYLEAAAAHAAPVTRHAVAAFSEMSGGCIAGTPTDLADALTRAMPAHNTVADFAASRGVSPDLMAQVGDLRAEIDRKYAHVHATLSGIRDSGQAPDENVAGLAGIEEEIRQIGHAINTFGLTCNSASRMFAQLLEYDADLRRQQLVQLQSIVDAKCRDRKSERRALPRQAGSSSRASLARTVWQAIFGTAPDYRPWHWLSPAIRQARAIVRDQCGRHERVLSVRGGDAACLAERAGHAEGHEIVAMADDLHAILMEQRPFDLCVIEGTFEDVAKFRSLFERVRPFLRPGGELTAFFLNSKGSDVPLDRCAFDYEKLPVCGPIEFEMVGGYLAVAEMRIKRGLEKALVQAVRMPRAVATAASIVLVAPLALVASVMGRRKASLSGRWPVHFAALIAVVRIG